MDHKMVKLDDSALDVVSGGSIVFNEDLTTCGRNCNNQYRVVNFDAIVQYYNENLYNMPEKQMMQNMLALGYIANL